MQKTIKSRIDSLERQLVGSSTAPAIVIITLMNASENGPQEIVPAGYASNLKGKSHYFHGSSEHAVTALRALLDKEPQTGKVHSIPVLFACLEAPTN
jgi:hypothetical protein